MNILIANHIKTLIEPLPYFDLCSGLVQTISKEDSADLGSIKTVRFPIEVNLEDERNAKAIVPNDNIKGLFFLEDGGSIYEGNNEWHSELTLVGWLCPKKISKNVNAVATHAISDITNLFKPFYNEGSINKLKVNIISSLIRDKSIFRLYSFSETHTQYLMPPYDFFALRIKANYRLNDNCFEPLAPPVLC